LGVREFKRVRAKQANYMLNTHYVVVCADF